MNDVARHGFRLEESAKRVGIDFVHQAPTFDKRLDHIMPQIAAMGAAVAVGDFDRDGWQDLYVTNSAEGSLNRLYRNKGDGTFIDVAGAMGVADVNREGTGVSMGALWGDFDNDGYEDLVSLQVRPARAFPTTTVGGGSCAFPNAPGFPAWVNANAAIWWDYDRRRLARSVPLGLLVRGHRSLAPEDDAHHARELRVRGEWRPQVRSSAIATMGRSRRRRRRSGSSRGVGR